MQSTGAGEVTLGPNTEARVWWQLTTRYRKGLDATMRARFGERILNFSSIVNVEEKNRELRITAWEGKGLD
jgi:head-tail adaptor